MIGTEFVKGQGMGNQLFLYIVARCIAMDMGVPFGTYGQEWFANNIHSNVGCYFMDIDLGKRIVDKGGYSEYHEKDDRLFVSNSKHDITYGCYVSGADTNLLQVPDNTLIYGNCQAEEYFIKHKEDICEWLKVLPKYEKYAFCSDDICVLNMRGGEYVNCKELFLNKKYWENAMEYMLHNNTNMRFVIITEDVATANKMFPDIPAYHLGVGEDYVAVKNAKHVILSNSSFAFWPVFTSNTIESIIAPKYWARHNVSDGYWASEQNIYSGWKYLDKQGRIFTAEQCRQELQLYKETSRKFTKINRQPTKNQKMLLEILCDIKGMMRYVTDSVLR